VKEGFVSNGARFRVYRASEPTLDEAGNEIAFTT